MVFEISFFLCGFGKNPSAATPAEQGENPPAARPAGFVDFATAPRLLATAFVVLEVAAAATCPQIAASAVLEAAATAPCPQPPPLPPRRVRGRLCW